MARGAWRRARVVSAAAATPVGRSAVTMAGRPEARLGIDFDAEDQQSMPEDLISRLSCLEGAETDGGAQGALPRGALPGGALPFSPFSGNYRGIRRALLRPPHHPGVMRAYVKRTKTLTTLRYDLHPQLG